ncbi:MAG TPA: SWIM zinc finger family protein, partial [Polyangium sp.]|nr:SWIM zinc finger family protein [Polyangium sp.]
MSASGIVRASDSEPHPVRVDLTPDGIKSSCTCATFAKGGQHCKHVAALLITLRDQARGTQPRPNPPQSHAPMHAPMHSSPHAQSMHSGGHAAADALKRVRRRERHGGVVPQAAPVPAVSMISSGQTSNLAASPLDATAKQTGIGAWLPPEGVGGVRRVEFRLHVRQGALTVTVLDAEARQPILPSVALSWQALAPTPDRDALRVLARFESGNPRHPAVDVRGEDVAELLPLLEGQRVLLEPALMQLRYSDDVLRPRFDLETIGGDTIIVKASFEKASDKRRFSLLQGGWFEGWPGWHIDTQEGIARRVDKRVSPAAMRRLLRSPTIGEPMRDLVRIIMQGLPKVALEVGAELPEISQIVDVVDLHPTFRMRAGGSLVEAHVQLWAAYGDEEVQVRADGITPPVLVQPPEEGMKRARCIRVDIAAQQDAAKKLAALGLRP